LFLQEINHENQNNPFFIPLTLMLIAGNVYGVDDLAKQAQNPVVKMISLPFPICISFSEIVV